MTAFVDLAPAFRGLFMTADLLLCFAAIYCIITAVIQRVPLVRLSLYLCLFVFDYLLLQPMFDISYHKEIGTQPMNFIVRLGQTPVVLLLFLMLALTGLTTLSIIRLRNSKRTHLSPVSVKESADSLPTGLCFCEENGRVLLVNSQMNTLCHKLTGQIMLDANAFWNVVKNRKVNYDISVLRSEPDVVIELPDKTVWLFCRQPLETDFGNVSQITATDITDTYRLSLELDAEIEKLRKMNVRLKAYSDAVFDMTREEENLAAKVQIHDKLGRVLITTRRYVEKKASKPQEQLLKLWKYNVALLSRENEPDPLDDPLCDIENAAELAGVKINVRGELPRDDKNALRLIKAAALESFNNAVHHAGATELTVTVRQNETSYNVTFANNGAPAAAPVIEGGGLTGLRRRVEQAGGEMHVESLPCFMLGISVPKKEVFKYGKCIDC